MKQVRLMTVMVVFGLALSLSGGADDGQAHFHAPPESATRLQRAKDKVTIKYLDYDWLLNTAN